VKNDFMMAINQVCHERQLPLDIVLEAVEVALVSAFKRNVGGYHLITAQIDSDTGAPLIFVEKAVTDEITDEKNQISLDDAQKINPHVQLGELISVESTPANFGRIAAQTAKQVILQRIREAERDALYKTYAEREGEVVNGTVHKLDSHQVTLSLGKVEAVLPRSEQIPSERYTEGQRLRAYVSNVLKTNRGPQIIVSRTHRNMLRRLLEVEVPEIYNGTVEIKSIAREAGYRSKVAVAALQEGVDPVGSCVGMRGTRIQSIVNELNGEKIDVVQWNPDLSYFIASSLSPAKVMNVILQDANGKTAVVVVPDKQLSLAIGKEGQNARLAAKLTGWRIDIKSASEAIGETINKLQENLALRERVADKDELFGMAAAIMEQKNPIDYADGELKIFAEAIDVVSLAEMAILREEKARQEAARLEAAKARDILAEAEAILSGQPATETEDELPVSEVEAGEAEPVEAEAETEPEEAVPEEKVTDEVAIEEPEPEPVAVDAEALLAEAEQQLADEEVAVEEPEVELSPAAEEQEVAVEAEAGVDEPLESEEPEEEAAEVAEEEPATKIQEEWMQALTTDDDWAADDEELDELERERQKQKARRKKRRLVYDERLGEVVAERRRKRSRRSGDWEDWLEDEDI